LYFAKYYKKPLKIHITSHAKLMLLINCNGNRVSINLHNNFLAYRLVNIIADLWCFHGKWKWWEK